MSARQQPAPPAASRTKPDSKKNTLILRGCVQGTTLTHVEPRQYATEAPSSVRLTGNRAIRGILKEHDGHWVELEGTLKGYNNMATGSLVKETGKTKVYVGATETRSGQNELERASPPTFDVASLTDLAPQCQAQ